MTSNDNNSLDLVSSKRRKKIEINQCISCQTVKRNENVTSTEIGRAKIIAASSAFQDHLLDDVDPNELLILKYHRQSCFKPYVLKYERFIKSNNNNNNNVEICEDVGSSQSSVVDKHKNDQVKKKKIWCVFKYKMMHYLPETVFQEG